MHHIKIMLSRLWQCADRTRDRLLFPGCDFAAWVTQEAAGFTPEQGNQYQPSTNALPQVLRRFPITSGDRILDVGCGKGKAMALMRRFPFGQVAGFDISPALADVANRNFRQLKLRDCHAFRVRRLQLSLFLQLPAQAGFPRGDRPPGRKPGPPPPVLPPYLSHPRIS